MCPLCACELADIDKHTLDIKYIQAVIHKCSCCCSAVQSSTWTHFVNMQIHDREISALLCFTMKCGWCTGCETIRRFAFQRQAQTHHISSSSSCKAFIDEFKEEKKRTDHSCLHTQRNECSHYKADPTLGCRCTHAHFHAVRRHDKYNQSKCLALCDQ